MHQPAIPVLGFAAFSGTGKTTLLEQLIPLLTRQGLKIGLIKHGHHDFDIDKPGKDSYRLRQAGASPLMIVSSHRRVIITEIIPPQDPRLHDQLQLFDPTGLDLVLVEGFKSEHFPKIELHRPTLGHPLLYPHDPDIIAIASDSPLVVPHYLPQLDINQPYLVCHFITQQFLGTL